MARRLFVALLPDAATRGRLAASAEALRRSLGPAARALRWVAPEALHLTVRFLGDVEEALLPAVGEAVAAAASGRRPLALTIGGASALPSLRRPRAILRTVGGELAPLSDLAASLSAGLERLGVPPEPRPSRPHVTLARVRDRRPPAGLGEALAAAPLEPVHWQAGELTLVWSELLQGGARHRPIRSARLGED